MTTPSRIVLTALSTALLAVGAAAAAQAAPLEQIARFNPKANKYCVQMAVPGSLVPRQICDSRRGWIDQGATIVAKGDAPKATQIATR